MTEEKKIRWYNQNVSLGTVVSLTLYTTAGLILLATMTASYGLVSWWLVLLAAVVPLAWLAALFGTLLYIQFRWARRNRTRFTVKLKIFSWTTERTWDFR
jgi:hypothetical protein